MLLEDARITVTILTPDMLIARHLLKNTPKSAGIITLSWDGRDDFSTLLPPEGYYPVISAVTDSGKSSTWGMANPSMISGGQNIVPSFAGSPLSISSGSTSGIDLELNLDRASRVCINAGIHRGPMMKTIVPWTALPAGKHIFHWNGMDDTGKFKVMEMAGNHVQVQGYSLPSHTIVIMDAPGSYSDYIRVLKQKIQTSQLQTISEDRFGLLRSTLLSGDRKNLAPGFLLRPSLSKAPGFTVTDRKPASGTMALSSISVPDDTMEFLIQVDDESVTDFNDTRYEIIVFVDNERIDEEEQACTPYLYKLDTSKYIPGDHIITFNLAGLMGQISSQSLMFTVKP
jgi:hypothetical protein